MRTLFIGLCAVWLTSSVLAAGCGDDQAHAAATAAGEGGSGGGGGGGAEAEPDVAAGGTMNGGTPACTAAKTDYTTGSDPQSVAMGDLNGDGALDLVVANNGSNTVSVLLGQGDGTFTPGVDWATGSGPCNVAAGDLDGDGRLDLAVTNYGSSTVSVLLNACR